MSRCSCTGSADIEEKEWDDCCWTCSDCGFMYCDDCIVAKCDLCEPHRTDQIRCPRCADPSVRIRGFVLCCFEFELGLGSEYLYCRTCGDFVDTSEHDGDGHEICQDKKENEDIAKAQRRTVEEGRLIEYRDQQR